MGVQKYLFNPLMKVESLLPENQVLMTVGIGMVMTEIVRFIFTSNYLLVKTGYSDKTFFLGGISFSVALTIAFGVACASRPRCSCSCSRPTWAAPSGRWPRTRRRPASWASTPNGSAPSPWAWGLRWWRRRGPCLLPIYYLFPDIGGPFTGEGFRHHHPGRPGLHRGGHLGRRHPGAGRGLGATYMGMDWEDMVGLVIFVLVLLFIPGGFKRLTKV